MKRIRLGLVTKVILGVGLMVAALGTFGSLYSYSFVLGALEKQREADLELVVSEEQENINRMFDDAQNTAKAISASLFAKQLLGGGLLDANDIDAYKAGGKHLAVYVMNGEGLTLASTDRKLIGQNYGFRKYFTDAKRDGVGLEVSIGVTTGQLGYYVSSAIRSKEGVFEGVVVVKLDPKIIDSMIEDTNKVGLVQMVVDEYGVVVASPNARERQYMSLGKLNAEELRAITEGKRYVGKEIKPLQYEQVQRVIRSTDHNLDEGTIKLTDEEDDDEEWIFVRGVVGGKLHLVSEARQAEVFALAQDSAVKMGGYFLMTTIVVLIVCGLILKLSLRSLGKIKEMANTISGGGVVAKNMVLTNDEVGDLGELLVDLSKKLRLSYESLEEKVKERTKELEESRMNLSQQLSQDAVKQKLLDTQNEKMSMTQRAIVNLLEDSREYERELKEQKEGVERLVAERTKELAEERSRLIASVEALVRGYVLVDTSKKVLLSNSALLSMLSTTIKPTRLEEIDDLLGEKIQLGEMYEKCFSNSEKIVLDNCEYGERVLSIVLNPVKQSGSESVSGVLIMIEDITEKKAIERSKEEFFSIASHELRTPLTAIRGNAAMIKEMILPRVKDPELEEMIGDIHEGSVRLIGIVNDFLELSRLEQGKLEFKKEVFDLGSCVNKIVEELSEGARTKGIIVRAENVGNTMVRGDRQKAMEVVTNLIGNGIKYTEKGEVVVKVILEGSQVKMLVKDTGRGIPLANRGLLFRKFQQAGNNLYTRDTAKSTGLGLYISKMMAEGMGGRIYLVKSEENWGSEFAFELPIA